jgi:hypothetical protein
MGESDRIHELERRLEAVESVLEIQNLKARYAELVDRRYGKGGVRPREELEPLAREIAELFSEDAVWDAGRVLGTCRGRDEIRQRFLEPTLLFSWHYFVKPQIHVDGDRARARWDILSPCTTADGRPHWMAGYEDDEYERVGGVWLHSSMKLTTVFLAPHERGWKKP